MPENTYLSDTTAQFDLDSVERKATLRLLMKPGIQFRLAEL
jgi:hypothetical protein